MNKIEVVSLDKQGKGFEKSIKKIAAKILKILGKNNVSVEIYLTASEKMKFLNKKFRGKDKAASILSFEEPRSFVLPPSKVKKIGEIYVKFPITNYPITQLLCHGLLHLFGYTHQKKNDTITMEKKEKFLISNL